MGFRYINDEQKIRISLSRKAFSTILEDMIIFEEERTTTFINTLLSNYCNESIASISTYLNNKKTELVSVLAEIPAKEKEVVINRLLEEEKRKAVNKIKSYLLDKDVSKLYHINNKNIDFLINDCLDAGFYNQKPGRFIKCVIEEYSRLPFTERERIYRKDVFEVVEYACNNHLTLKTKITVNNQVRKVIVYPYKIMPDPYNTQLYLVCFSRFEEDLSKEKMDTSFSMARFQMPTVLNQKAFFSKADRDKIEKDIENLSPAYMFGEAKEIRIKFTEQGKKIYSNKLFARPTINTEKSSENEWVFYCSEKQAYNYFFTFGKEIEIISPESLKKKFIDNAEKIVGVYKGEK